MLFLSILQKGIARREGFCLAASFGSGYRYMVIVTDFRCPVHEYAEQVCQFEFPRPNRCPHCNELDVLIGHGFYVRKALGLAQVYVIRIKRWYCKACERTVSMLPSFLLRFRWYLVAVIQSSVIARFEQGASWASLSRSSTVEGGPSARTIRRWCESLAQQAPVWWAMVQHTLAQHDPASPALDPLGERAGPVEMPKALLHAMLHLLAWAKTCWAEVARYGLDERLSFLWQWGHGQGLGRLI